MRFGGYKVPLEDRFRSASQRQEHSLRHSKCWRVLLLIASTDHPPQARRKCFAKVMLRNLVVPKSIEINPSAEAYASNRSDFIACEQ